MTSATRAAAAAKVKVSAGADVVPQPAAQHRAGGPAGAEPKGRVQPLAARLKAAAEEVMDRGERGRVVSAEGRRVQQLRQQRARPTLAPASR